MATKRTPKQDFVRVALDKGALGAKLIAPATVETAHWVRWKCQFGCGGFGSSLVCPPHSPTPDETRKMLDEYKRAVLFESPSGKTKKIAAALEREFFLAGHYKALGLGSGPCLLCDECAFDEGCRHPDDARPSMEACGIDVYATVRANGMPIHVLCSEDEQGDYYGLVLVD